MELRSKCALVTGGAMGIGLSTVKRLLKEECIVTIWDINEQALCKAEEDLKVYGGKCFLQQCDITDKKRVYELADIARSQMGKVDILINNAGYISGGEILDKPDENWEKTINVNLTSLIYTIRAFLPEMYERNSGHIINISSASSTLGVPGLAVYTATKWAVWGLTESLRMEAYNNRKFGVKYSTIHPSYIAHGMFQGAKLSFPGNLLVPIVKDHDIIAKAIVESAIKKGRYSPKRPFTVNLNVRLRGLLPDSWFQKLMILMGVTDSMKSWTGRK